MKTENILLIVVILLSFFLGGLTSFVFLHPKTITVANTTFLSPPDSVVTLPNIHNGKPDKVVRITQGVQSSLRDSLAPAVPPIQIVKDSLKQGNAPYGKELASYKTFTDSLGVYIVKAISDCPVKSFELEIRHKPMQFVSDCNPLANFVYGGLVGIILTLITAIIFIL